MITINSLQDSDALHAIETGEFKDSIIGSKDKVAIILTQNWCSQWKYLERDLVKHKHSTDIELDIYFFIYNRSPLFHSFLRFKEDSFDNDQIPYIRYYKNGTFFKDSNFISLPDLLNLFL